MIKQPRILSVDDDAHSAELVVRVAERCGFEGFATSDSRGVINLANALQPEVITIDVNMPNVDANGLLELLAADKYLGQVIVISGAEPKILDSTQNFGASLGLSMPFVLQKPVDFKALRDGLTKTFERTAA